MMDRAKVKESFDREHKGPNTLGHAVVAAIEEATRPLEERISKLERTRKRPPKAKKKK